MIRAAIVQVFDNMQPTPSGETSMSTPLPQWLQRARARRALCGLLLALTSNVAWCADTAPVLPDGASVTAPDRPRIGLVLSGGGARGAAHVGVLRELERMRIPIDAIAGTSMGAVVGGLYAAGLSGEEIERLFGALDWQDLTRDRAQRSDLVYRRKQDDRNILARGALGVSSDGIVLPLGLLQGRKITQVLRKATLPVADVSDFDALPTPFRALATDLETGQPVVLKSGDLATVLRASMSAPGVLEPVEIGGRLLVDGGLVDNLPVDLARQMGVDTLIVVDVSFPLARREGLQSALDVTNQMIGIMVRRQTLETKAHLTAGDVLIEPDLGRMTSLDFTRVPQSMAAGGSAVQKVAPRLAALGVSESAYARYVAVRHGGVDAPVQVAFVRPGPRSQRDAEKIEAVFGDLAGKPIDTQKLQQRMTREYGLDRYELVDYRVVHDGTLQGLEIDLNRKSWGPTFLRLGVGVESDFDGGATANAGARLLMTDLNHLDGEWLTDLQIGEEPRFATEFFQPLSVRNSLFVAPGYQYTLDTLQVLNQGGDRIARYRVRESVASLAFGAELSNWGEIRVGLRAGDGSRKVLIGDPTLPADRFDMGGAYAQFGYDRLDSAYFPKRGQALRLSYFADRKSLGADVDADIIQASWQIARTAGRNTVILSVDGGSALDDRVNSPLQLFRLGGFLDLSGLPPDSLSGTQYGIARTMFYRKVSRGGTGFFEFPAYAGFSLEAGNVWQRRRDVKLSDLETSGSLFLGAESPFGPVYLAAGLGEGGERAFYLYLGKTF
jgi:NTE family protein